MQQWTIERVKQELPDVWCKRPDGSIILAAVRGRKLDFAHVHTSNGGMAEVAWSTIANVLNRGGYVLL